MTNRRPYILIERELNAAARLSFSNSMAVAMADELAPITTPIVTKASVVI